MLNIRNALPEDVGQIMNLLSQVLELHATIRPDIFVPGTTKYTPGELLDIFKNEKRRTYVAEDDEGHVIGYAFCEIREQPFATDMVQFKSFFIDDLCVDKDARGKHVGRELFEYCRREAAKLDCYEITLNVWEGNDSARVFYEKMGMRPKETQMELIL